MRESLYEVRVPDSLSQYGFSKKDIQRRFVEWLVFSLFTEGRASSGKAAQLLGISRIEFLELLRNRGVAYINFTPDELSEEFTASKNLKTKSPK
jgi:predicted HTH domain antitoxin